MLLKIKSLVLLILFALTITIAYGQSNDTKPKKSLLMVQAVANQGEAAEGNTETANLLVVVTNPNNGLGIKGLTESNFTIVHHFAAKQKGCDFSKKIKGLVYAGKGAYRIKFGLNPDLPDCTWEKGDHVAQIFVQQDQRRGQTVTTLTIK
jgi:hypothetical protein